MPHDYTPPDVGTPPLVWAERFEELAVEHGKLQQRYETLRFRAERVVTVWHQVKEDDLEAVIKAMQQLEQALRRRR